MIEIAITILVVGAYIAFMFGIEEGIGKFFKVAAVEILICIPFLIMGFSGVQFETSSGEHTGFVTAAQKNGVIFKTGRAYIKTDLSSSQEDIYCVKDDSVLAQLQEAAKSRERVTVKYKGNLVNGLVNCGNEGEFIYQVN